MMAMEAGEERHTNRSSAPAFWWRLIDNASRRIVWLFIPIVLFTALGFYQASRTQELYRSTGVLSASSNPLVPAQQLGTATPEWWETPASAASRTINEQLRTDAFIESVADRAGLADAVTNGLVSLQVIRANLWSSADGTSLVFVNATWSDPQTTFALVDGAIVAYQEFLADTVASQSSTAVAFYQTQLERLEAEVEAAQEQLDAYILTLPDEDEDSPRSIAVDLQLTRLTDAVSAAEGAVVAAEGQIDAALLAVEQSKSEAGRSLTVIDAPKVPTAPESTFISKATTVVSFSLLGLVIVLGALLVGTVLDQSVASSSDLRAIEGVAFVATVPVLRFATDVHGRRRERTPRRAKRTSEPREPVGV